MVPKLRFREFDGAWREKKIEEIFSSIAGGGTPSKDDSYWAGNIPWISSSDVSEDSITGIDVTRFISESAIKNSATKLIPRDSVLVVSRVGVGKVAISKFELCTSQDFTNLIGCKGNPYFYAYLLSHYMKRKASSVQGTAIKGLPSAEIKGYSVFAPDLGEQQKIADFFSTLDKKIELNERKLEALEKLKKEVMKKIFIQSIRFQDKKGEDFPKWKVLSLGELAVFKNGVSKSKECFGKGSPFVNLQDVFNKNSLKNSSFNLVHITPEEIEVFNLKKGDILFVRSSVKPSGVGLTCLIEEDIPKTVYSGFLIRCRFKNNYLIDSYKKYCFLEDDFRRILLSKSSVSANTNINQNSLASVPVKVPCLEEQKLISGVLELLDLKIDVVEKKIDYLKKLKQGFMQQMFV